MIDRVGPHLPDHFTFRATVWLWPGEAPWHFVSLPEDIADAIADRADGIRKGFGTVRVEVRSGDVHWNTSVFPDKKSGTYLLPLKKQIRSKLNCEEGSTLDVELRVAT